MRILILGAGAIGGYFGARLHEAGGNVTFLVREARAGQLAKHGLYVESPCGNVRIKPRAITSDAPREHFDVVILTCKAYDLGSAVDSILPFAGPDSIILPLLNGLAHLDLLDSLFGLNRVLGGVAHLAVTLTPEGEIRHLNNMHKLIFGSRSSQASQRLSPFAELLSAMPVDYRVSDNVEQDMWDKWVFLSTLAAATCTMRSAIGAILDTIAGEQFILGLLRESESVAAASDFAPGAKQLATYRAQLTERGSTLTASMLRDIERGGPTEADHILGDMVRRGDARGVPIPLLHLAYSHLQAYEARRASTARN
ncbi:MAG: 2-dehydropantoate 2-reductase [Burkholderiales bacterium]